MVLAMTLALVAAACGNGADNGAGDATPADGTDSPDGTETDGQAAGELPSDAGGDWADRDEIRIGIIMPFSGPIGFLGDFIENSVQVEVDRINENGGIGGAQISIVTRDNELNPQLAVQAAQELSGDESITFVIGPAFTGFYNAVKEIYEENQLVNCNPVISGAEALDGIEYTFRWQDPDQFRVPRLLQYLEDNTDVSSIALVYEDDDTGQGYDRMLSEIASDYGMEYAGFQATRPDDQSHRSQVEAVQDADAILVSNNATSAAKTAAAVDEIGYEGLLVGLSGLQGFTYIEGGGDGAEGTIFVGNYIGFFTDDPEDTWPERYRRHVQQVVEQYGVTEGPQTGVDQFNGTTLPADCLVAYARAANGAQSFEADAVVSSWESLDIPAEETLSFVNAQFGPDDHEAYGQEDLFVYEWTRNEDGEWFTDLLETPDYFEPGN